MSQFALFLLALLLLGTMRSATVSAAAPVAATSDLASSSNQTVSPEQQLIDRYAPIIGLRQQDAPCDTKGEPWYPVAVSAVLGQPDVALKRASPGSASSDELILTGPSAHDLFGLGDDAYLDLPGNPRHPGCRYETWFKSTSRGATPTTYAHIVAGDSRLAVQFWFYYVFNRFNNTHESDWEMMQIIFDVGTVEEALLTEPVAVGLAQHGGGESANWTSDKLQRDGKHPVIFAAAGSHATQYGSAVYLGWGENGTGFGCDTTTGPSSRVLLTTVLLPDSVPEAGSDFAWLAFTGRWGERQRGEYNGPTGPNTKSQWTDPFTWQEDLRDSSLKIPGSKTFGPAPADVFCALSTAGSNLYRQVGDSPPALLTSALILLAGIVAFLRLAWNRFGEAIGIYRERWQTFALAGIWLIPVGIAFNGFRYLVTDLPPGSTLFDLLNHTPGANFAIAMLLLVLQHLAGLIVVGPMVIEIHRELEHNRQLSFRQSWDNTRKALPELGRSAALVTLVLVTLSLTLIGIPVAIWLVGRWMFFPQASMLNGKTRREALMASSSAVAGRWWRVMLTGLAIFVLAAAPGAIIGLALLILGDASVQFTNAMSSLIYVVTVPVSVIAMTMLYRDHRLPSALATAE